MKKLFLLSVVVLLTSCSIQSVNNTVSDEKDSQEPVYEVQDEEESKNEIKLGLFLSDNNYQNKEKLEDAYYTKFISGTDIGTFEVFLTDNNIVNGNSFIDIWNTYYDTYQNINNYKIGFNIKFILSNGTNYNGNFLEPDIYKYSKYFNVYLYDDIHNETRDNITYLKGMQENTILTSIRINANDGIDNVENIILSVFAYDSEDDFDSAGNYIGSLIYVIRIKRK